VNPLIDKFTKNLSGCSGCGNSLGNPEFDYLWKTEGENDARILGKSDETDSDNRRQSGGSAEETY
jgi:hypothetical protein